MDIIKIVFIGDEESIGLTYGRAYQFIAKNLKKCYIITSKEEALKSNSLYYDIDHFISQEEWIARQREAK